MSRMDQSAQRMRLIPEHPRRWYSHRHGDALVEVQNFTRFKTSEEIASYIGLTPFRIFNRTVRPPAEDHPVREQKSEGGPYRKQLDPCGERPTHTGKVSETEKLQGCQEGDCCHCTEVDHTDTSHAFAERTL